jgi:hypothetical protein
MIETYVRCENLGLGSQSRTFPLFIRTEIDNLRKSDREATESHQPYASPTSSFQNVPAKTKLKPILETYVDGFESTLY